MNYLLKISLLITLTLTTKAAVTVAQFTVESTSPRAGEMATLLLRIDEAKGICDVVLSDRRGISGLDFNIPPTYYLDLRREDGAVSGTTYGGKGVKLHDHRGSANQGGRADIYFEIEMPTGPAMWFQTVRP